VKEASSDRSVAVVVAAWPGLDGLREFLDTVVAQADDQVDVVAVTTVEVPHDILGRFPRVKWSRLGADALIPHLWARGMLACESELIATTTSHFLPSSDWIAQIRAAHARSPAVGIGGRIDPPSGAGPIAWATYLLRYSHDFQYGTEQPVSDLAADNASYKRRALVEHADTWQKGFWEPVFHQRVRAKGEQLVFIPSIAVRQISSFGFWPFVGQRWQHGLQYGRDRLAGKSAWFRLTAILGSPLVPFILFLKIASRLRWRPGLLPAFVWSSAPLCLFILAWALGEAGGYVAGRGSGKASGTLPIKSFP
jgi:hypothetical protein